MPINANAESHTCIRRNDNGGGLDSQEAEKKPEENEVWITKEQNNQMDEMRDSGCYHCDKSWAAGSQVVEINKGETDYMTGEAILHPLCNQCFLLWEKLREKQEDDRREFLGLERLFDNDDDDDEKVDLMRRFWSDEVSK